MKPPKVRQPVASREQQRDDPACIEVTRINGRTAVFCLRCQQPVERYKLQTGSGTVIAGGFAGKGTKYQFVENGGDYSGRVTLFVRCHGQEFWLTREALLR